MNTMFYTKILGGVCGSLLILLLVKWGADAYFYPSTGSSHGEEAAAAYAIAVEDDGSADEVAEVPFADLLAVADVSAGERKFGKCISCHKIGPGENGIGPTLFEIVGRVKNSTDFGSYSGNLPDGTWTVENLDAFLESPRSYAPGTTMGFGGFSKATDRANVIAFLSTL